jgi:hypothetical protein
MEGGLAPVGSKHVIILDMFHNILYLAVQDITELV